MALLYIVQIILQELFAIIFISPEKYLAILLSVVYKGNMRINTERIQKEMKRRKWKVEDLALACDPPVTRQAVEYTIKHNSLKGLERISKVLDIPITKLIINE